MIIEQEGVNNNENGPEMGPEASRHRSFRGLDLEAGAGKMKGEI